jgi:hypothetical protein
MRPLMRRTLLLLAASLVLGAGMASPARADEPPVAPSTLTSVMDILPGPGSCC